jgi:tetratricopeptide (TPR) repeat protein
MGIQTVGPRAATPFAYRLAAAGADIGRFVAPGLVATWLAVLVLLGKPSSGLNVYQDTVSLHVLLGIPALVYAMWLAGSRRLPGPTALDWCALAFVAVLGVSVATSVNPRISLEAALSLGMAVLAFYIAHDVKSLSVQYWARTLIALAGFVSILGLISVALQYLNWLQQVSAVKPELTAADYLPPMLFRVRAVLDHPNVFAMFLNLTLPFAAARMVMGRGAERKLAIAVLCLGFGGVFFSGTRGAWMGTIAWSCVFLTLLIAWRQGLDRPWQLLPALSQSWLRRAVVAGVAVVAGMFSLAILVDIRPDWLFRATLDDRLEAARTALAIFSDNWATGAGPYTHFLIDDVYGDRDAGFPAVFHAHNVYAQTLADLGVAGATVMLAGLLVALRMLAVAWRTAPAGERLYVAAGAAATAGFMIHGLSESPPSWNSVFVPFGLVLGLAARFAPRTAALRASGFSRFPRVAVLALVPLALVVWLSMDNSHSHYSRSLLALQEGRLDEAAAQAVQAADGDDRLYAYAIHAGVLRVQQYQEAARKGDGDPALLEEGIGYLTRATEVDPHSALAFANLALAFQLRGDMDAAVESARAAGVDGPADEDVHSSAGTVFEAAGLLDEAMDAYAAALALDPALAYAPFWTTSPARTALRAEVIARSGIDACDLGKAVALYGVALHELSGLASGCQAMVDELNHGDDAAVLALMLHRLGRLEEARGYAMAAQDLSPGSRTVMLSAAIVLSNNLSETRFGLMKAAALYEPNAKALLLATYLPDSGVKHGISLPIERETAEIPPVIAALMPAFNPDSPVDVGALTSARSNSYFRWGALRQAPPTVLIVGDWTAVVSPRQLLSAELAKVLSRAHLID